MEDCCVVCSEPLVWIGYGPCNHRVVCLTCVARMRVENEKRCCICRHVENEKRCCICRQECPTVFVTKALGENTRVVTDWAPLVNHRYSLTDWTPLRDISSNNVGRESLWYDNVVEAYFDNEEPFNIIRAQHGRHGLAALNLSQASIVAALRRIGVNRALTEANFNESRALIRAALHNGDLLGENASARGIQVLTEVEIDKILVGGTFYRNLVQ